MTIKEFYKTREDGVNLYRTFSDQNLKISKIGTDEVYEEAVDIENAPYIYEETAEPIESADGWAEIDEPVEDTTPIDGLE